MKANKLKKSLIAASLMTGIFSMPSQAADLDLDFSFSTIVAVEIVETTPLDFGDDLAISANSTCTLLVDTTNRPGSVDIRQGLTSSVSEASTFQSRTGDCDNSQTGTAGIYTITGAPGVDVTITVNPILPAAGENFSFVPTGAVVDYEAGTTDDLFTAFTSGADLSGITLAASDNISTTGVPLPGSTLLYVGGTLTTLQTLDAGTTYSDQEFIIDVVY